MQKYLIRVFTMGNHNIWDFHVSALNIESAEVAGVKLQALMDGARHVVLLDSLWDRILRLFS